MGKGSTAAAKKEVCRKLVIRGKGEEKKKKPPRGKKKASNSEGYFSGGCLPSNTKRGARESEEALKAKVLVLEIDGHFMKVPLSQGLKFSQVSEGRRKGALERYNRYRGSKTLKEALRAGAIPDDLYYDIKHGALSFEPSLKAKMVTEPLPFSEWPEGVRRPDVGRVRPFWLPDDWAWGVKTTCPTYLPAFIAPNKRIYYHRPVIEKIVQCQLGGVKGMQEHGAEMIKENLSWSGKKYAFADDKLFKLLTPQERKHLPKTEDLHFCVVSARRATERTGIRGIVNVQSQFLKSGASPTYYVDNESVEEYKKIGLEHVKAGGKLTPARNMALRDAEKAGKACVQVSDDISRWEYHKGSLGDLKGFDGSEKLAKANKAVRSKDRIVISPVAAAKYLLARMRGKAPPGRGATRPRLGGVFPTGNAAMGLLCEAVSEEGFILGDFFVHDKSPVRFDTKMSLKEDYDFTCSHLDKHGSVLRCNRLVVHVAHETNAGGAVATRDRKGLREQHNIQLLQRKWPGVFRKHGTRGENQVILKWSKRTNR